MMKFTETHEWIEVEGSVAKVGISHFAQKELGDAVYVELPGLGREIKAGDEVVVVESTKAAVDIYSPVSGKIIAVNEELKSHPELINQSPESQGWLYKIELKKSEELSSLMDADTYKDYVSK